MYHLEGYLKFHVYERMGRLEEMRQGIKTLENKDQIFLKMKTKREERKALEEELCQGQHMSSLKTMDSQGK